MRPERLRIDDFKGVALDVHRAKLPPGLFQADAGGDHYERGTWKVRRGHRKTTMTAGAAPSSTGATRIRLAYGFELSSGDFACLLVGGTSGQSVYGHSNPDAGSGQTAGTTLSTGLTADQHPYATAFRRVAYLSDGWRAAKRWDGRSATTETVGIVGPSRQTDSWTPTPNQAGAGSVKAGVHLVRYRYMDSKTGYVSDPSEARSITAPGAKSMIFDIDNAGVAKILRSSDAKVDRIVVEMTVAAGTEFFNAAEAAESAATITVDLTDVSLGQAPLEWPEDGLAPPPVTRYLVAHQGRLWAFGQITYAAGTVAVTNGSPTVTGTSTDWTTDALGASGSPSDVAWYFKRSGDTRAYKVSYAGSATSITLEENYAGSTGSGASYVLFTQAPPVFVSQADYPEGFDPLSTIKPDESELGGPITAGIGYGPNMIFYSARGMFALIFTVEPSDDGRRSVITGGRGAVHQRVVVAHEHRIYAMDRLGFHYYEGIFPKHISRPIDQHLDDLNWAAVEEFHGVYLPQLRAIRWYVCLGSDTYPQDYVQYDVDTGTWTTGEMDLAITESHLVPTADGLRVLIGDYYGQVWLADEGTVDGGVAANSHLTVAAGSTLASIATAEGSLPTTGEGLIGVMAWWVEGNEVRRVHSNTATNLGFDATIGQFSSLPAVGDHLRLGRVRAKLKTPAFHARGGAQQSRALHLLFEPLSSAREALVRVYEDYSATAKEWGAKSFRDDQRRATPPDDGETDWKVDLRATGGVVRVPLGAQFSRCVEVEVELLEPDAAFELHGIEVDGVVADEVAS